MMIASHAENALRRIIVPLGAGLIALATLARGPAQAAPRTFVLDQHEGYGVVSCLVDGIACGKLVANAFCESQGLGKALACGAAADVTASIGGISTPKIAPGSILITCGD